VHPCPLAQLCNAPLGRASWSSSLLNIGVDLGVMPPPAFAAFVFASLASMLLTLPLLHGVYPVETLRGTLHPCHAEPQHNDALPAPLPLPPLRLCTPPIRS